MILQKFILLIGLVSLLFIFACSMTETQLKEKAAEIHDKALTIDTHTDTPLHLEKGDFDLSQAHDPRDKGSKVDFPRMQAGGLDAVFFATFIGQGPRTPEGNENAKSSALEIIENIHQAVGENSELATLATAADDAAKIEKNGERAIYIGLENGYPVGQDLSLVEKFYEKGVRYITLCHTKNNDICDSSTDPDGPEFNGVSEFGEQVVAEMNRLGMLVDVSHISDEAFYDVIQLTKTPVMASHSCARAICDNPRNLDDAMLRKLAENGGVIQMCILSDYVKAPTPNAQRDSAFAEFRKKYKNWNELPDSVQQKGREEWYALDTKYSRELATVSDVVDHIDHIVKVAGIDHVGIGTDFDGGGGVDGCFDVSEMGNITLELVRRGYSEEQIRKIWGGNFLRVFREVEKFAREQKQGDA